MENIKQNLSKLDSATKKSTPFDTTRGAKLKSFGKNSKFTFRKTFGIDSLKPNEVPKIAFVRSMILPGWGQMTNKNYLKLPLIYGSAGVGVYFISFNNNLYHKYKDYVVEMQLQGLTEREIDGGGPYSITLITTAANQYRRYKQLSFVGLGLGWLLFAIEANVSAHLKTFDVSNDISFKISPSLLNTSLNNNQALGIKLALNF
ncbi:hypothetical protein EGI22_09790 [Lacihabitans sp. LS3-19]|uniref:DUF5683 domain-containing protein n=1 Tax=Lacihabitans sp. LS3-19 TaxID=2487335 RepID=UPI0020CE9DFD|nr:DUF5683 domain-containing protein [Lacihabitans sp. LS3-19]MCP9768203.1 hypothetical protein [Lacihabitans sp. LS3-19]